MAWDLGKLEILDRMAKWPVPNIVQQGCGNKNLGIVRVHPLMETWIAGKPVQAEKCQAVGAQRVFETGVMSSRVDE